MVLLSVERPIPRYCRHSPEAVRSVALSKAVAQGVATLFGIGFRPHVRVERQNWNGQPIALLLPARFDPTKLPVNRGNRVDEQKRGCRDTSAGSRCIESTGDVTGCLVPPCPGTFSFSMICRAAVALRLFVGLGMADDVKAVIVRALSAAARPARPSRRPGASTTRDGAGPRLTRTGRSWHNDFPQVVGALCRYSTKSYALPAPNMIHPALPINEATRLDTLRSLNILDTSAEERFDRLTRLAKRLFGVPIALISLVDADRQWFKSCQGLNATETPRDVSFCGHAILGDLIMMVPDALLDERFHDNPLVVGDPGIRFYAGCPLQVPNGSKLGTLCLIDVEPRTMDEGDLQLLRDLTRMAEQEIAAVQLATMDELTMLSNRRGFMALGQHTLSLCVRRMERPASLLYFDLDGFKAINDRFGHAEGDRALTAFAKLLTQTFRDSDVVGRLGGDEFAALLTDSADAECVVVIQRLQQAVDAYNQTSQRGYDIRFSVGDIAFEPTRHSSIDSLVADADTRMYERKRQKKVA